MEYKDLTNGEKIALLEITFKMHGSFKWKDQEEEKLPMHFDQYVKKYADLARIAANQV